MWVSEAPGMEVRVPWPIRALVVLASVATPLCAMAAALVATRALRVDGRVEWPVILGPPAAVLLVLWWALRRDTPVPRWIRAACVLVPVHACLIVVFGILWSRASTVIRLDELLPLSEQIPVEQAGALAAVVLLAAALVSLSRARRRGVPRWLSIAVRFLLAHLVALGIIVPLVAIARQLGSSADTLPSVPEILGLTFTLALASTLASGKYADINRIFAAFAVVGAIISTVLAPLMTNDARWIYSNFGPLIVANVFLALVAINLLGIFHWYAVRPTTLSDPTLARHSGTVSTDDVPASWVRCRGWMEGLHIESRPFRVQTSTGELEVPERSNIVVPLPLSTIHLETGKTIPVLAHGDRVGATGYVDAPSGGPFRQSTLPVPGRNGIVVTALADTASPRQNAVLAIWRPSCLYLAVATLIAAPAIVASLTYDHPISLMLNGFARADVCGNPGQPCCGEVSYCHFGADCESNRMCVACGGVGQACCGGTYCGEKLHCEHGSKPKCADGPAPVYSFHEEPESLGFEPAHVHKGEQLKASDIQRGMAKVKAKVQACYDQFGVPELVNVLITINPSGRVGSAWVMGKFRGTPTGYCIERAVGTATFPRFKGEEMTGIEYPFMLSK